MSSPTTGFVLFGRVIFGERFEAEHDDQPGDQKMVPGRVIFDEIPVMGQMEVI